MPVYLLIAQIILAVTLIIVLTLQVKGGGLGGIFGQADGVYRTRRGVEKSLLQITVGIFVLFIIISIVLVRLSST